MNDPVGVAVVGHGSTASTMLAAARNILPPGSLDGVIAIDAGLGETPTFSDATCAAIAKADRGRGVIALVDLFGASPCQCVQREGAGHGMIVVSGLSLAMLLKLGNIDRRRLDPRQIAEACAEAGRRAVGVDTRDLGMSRAATDSDSSEGK
jgi:PTS system mannose-specific IIA component